MSDGAWKVERAGHGRTGWRIRSPLHPRALAAGSAFNIRRGEAQRVADWLNGPEGLGFSTTGSRMPMALLEVARPGHAAEAHRKASESNKDSVKAARSLARGRGEPAQTDAEIEADRLLMEAARATLAELRGPDEPLPTPGTEADTFRCGRTACTLSGTACARRWADIDAKARRTRAGIAEVTAFQASLDKCHKCDAGRARADALGITRGKPELVRFIGTGPDHRNFAPPAGA